MLSVLDAIDDPALEFVVMGPQKGALAEAVEHRGIEYESIQFQDAAGRRIERDQMITQVISAVRRCGADLLHGNSLAMGRLTGAIASQISIHCTSHLRDIVRLSQAAVRDLNQNQHLVAVSRATRDFHVAQGVSAERTVVVHNGVDLDQFRPRVPDGRIKAELQLDAASKLIATIGQIGLRKGQDVLAAAARQVIAGFPDAHFVLIGERNSRKQENVEFERALVEQFPAGRLHCLGYRDDIPRLLPEFDLLVHPARQEPFGRVLLEAAACGIPIVATDVGGTSEMLTNGESALLVPPDDPERMAAAIEVLLHDDEQRRLLASAARSRIEADFSIGRAAEAHRQLWSSAAGGSSTSVSGEFR